MEHALTGHEIPAEPHAMPPANWKQNRKLILASASPRRCALLKSMALRFDVIVSGVGEEGVAAENARQLTQELACMKAEAVVPKSGDAIIVGADSLVEFEGTHIGKPKTLEDARRFFQRCGGKPQDVYTGVCVLDAKSGKCVTDSIHSVVEFNPLSNGQINKWLQEGSPLDLAGGYYIYEIIKRGFIKRILHTDADNVAGLPRLRVKEMLAQLGFYDA